MEPNWSHQGFYNYYPHDPSRSSGERQNTNTSPTNDPGPQDSGSIHRRSQTQPTSGGTFLPPPPHASPHNHMNLPPFSQTFYSSYHSSAGAGGHQPSASAPANLPLAYGNNQPMSAPPGGGGYPYSMTSPVNMPNTSLSRQPPPHSYNESPRISAPGGWSSSPAGFRHLSPTSPTTHLAPPGVMASSASTSSSSHPSATRTPSMLPKTKRRSGSASQSAESWDEGDRGMGMELGEETEEQPWGMPQDEYKKLNPRDKKQVRNRIGARRFRAKRKDYVSNIENSLRAREDEVSSLRNQVDAQRSEINNLRARLGMPLLQSPPSVLDGPGGGLGLLVNHSDGWDEKD